MIKVALFILLFSLIITDRNSYAQNTQLPAAAAEAAPANNLDNPTSDEMNAPTEVPVQAVVPPVLPPEMTDPLLEGFFEDSSYNPVDKRDPFLPYLNPAFKLAQVPQSSLEPLQKFALAELKLVGIIWDVGTPKALIADPSGKSHIILENTKMGNGMGYVAAIREGEIIVVEPQVSPDGRKSFQTKILKMTSAKE